MTQIEFETRYLKNSGITIEQYSKTRVTLKCNCGESECNGWAAVRNTPDGISSHNRHFSLPANQRVINERI